VTIWIEAARPRTLPAAIAPVVVGTACAHASGGIAWGPAAAALGGALAILIATNFANDVSDAARGTDGPDRIGPRRAVASGAIAAATMVRAAIVAALIAVGFGTYLAAVAGWPVIAIGVFSLVAAFAYTGGPWPLGYHGLGDATVAIFFGGVAVCGAAWVQLGHVPAVAAWSAAPVGALATAILVVNNLRDRHGDARAGKRTLAVRLGRRGTIVEYAGLLAVAYLALIPIGIAVGSAWPALALASAPLAVARVRAIATLDGSALNPLLGATARLLIIYSALLAIGIAIGGS
jgi:1,4-dihydroxy-2-naphthoate octaprenyltransferase